MNGTEPEPPERVTLVLGLVAGGTGAHVKMLATGLAAGGAGVSVAGPSSADRRFSFSAAPPVAFSAVEIADRPRLGDLAGILRLRKLLLRAAAGDASPGVHGGGHVVHAHGLRAGALTVLALVLAGAERRPGLVVTVHNASPGGAVAGGVYRVLERVVARGGVAQKRVALLGRTLHGCLQQAIDLFPTVGIHRPSRRSVRGKATPWQCSSRASR